MLPDDVPTAVKDAIMVTILLGHQVLWVDKYCIDQDNDEIRHIQIQNMHKLTMTGT